MKKFIFIFLLMLFIMPLSPSLSGACSGIKFRFSWKEPKLNIDGTALTDLSKTTLYYSINGKTNKKDYAPSSAAGGRTKSAIITMPMNCRTMQNDLKIWTTATNKLGSESGASNILNISVPLIKEAL